MSTPTTPTPRTKQQIGALAYEIYEAIKTAEFTYDELVHFGHSVYSKIDINQLRASAKTPQIGVGVLTKLFKLAELLDGKFPLPAIATAPLEIPAEPPAPIAPAAPAPAASVPTNGHAPTPPNAQELIARAVAGAPPVQPGAQESSGG